MSYPPIPCAHCGGNFMRHDLDPNAPKLCNNCSVREEKRNPKGDKKMENIGVLIQCPKDVYIEIEELCVNNGTNPTRYFLELHYGSQAVIKEMKALHYEDVQINPNTFKEDKPTFEMSKKQAVEEFEKTLPKNKGKKK